MIEQTVSMKHWLEYFKNSCFIFQISFPLILAISGAIDANDFISRSNDLKFFKILTVAIQENSYSWIAFYLHFVPGPRGSFSCERRPRFAVDNR